MLKFIAFLRDYFYFSARSMWIDFLKSYRRRFKGAPLVFPRDFECELFCNKKINRTCVQLVFFYVAHKGKLSPDGVYSILDEMVAQGYLRFVFDDFSNTGYGTWLGNDRSEFSLTYRTNQEWGNLIYKWVPTIYFYFFKDVMHRGISATFMADNLTGE